jgi:PKD repeat protein
MQFKSTINEIPNPISEYSWSFWDGRTNASEHLEKTDHVYSQKWIYTVTLTVYDMQWNSNTVTEKVFIWEIEYPIAAYRVKDSRW